MYHDVNMMFGDIVKVTPSSKVVGDMTLFMVQNGLTEKGYLRKRRYPQLPQSVVEFFEGRLGIPYQGFPEKLQSIILKGRKPLTERPARAWLLSTSKPSARNWPAQATSTKTKISTHTASTKRYLRITMKISSCTAT